MVAGTAGAGDPIGKVSALGDGVGAVEGESAANMVAQHEVVVERGVAAEPRRLGGGGETLAARGDRAQRVGRESQGSVAPWPDIWLTARTAWVRELTLSARSTAAT